MVCQIKCCIDQRGGIEMSKSSNYMESNQPAGIAKLYAKAAQLDRFGMALLRFGLVVVLLWIGGLKFVPYEADSIVPLVANSPAMRFFYHHPAPEYKHHMNK